MVKGEAWNKVILYATGAILIAIEFYSLSLGSHFQYDFLALIFLLLLVYNLRYKIALHPVHFLIFSIFLLLHNFGVFGFYETFPFGLEYDFYVHFYFGFVGSLMLYRAYSLSGPYRGWFMYVIVIGLMLGMSAAHEILEFGSEQLNGEGAGVFFQGAGDTDEADTQKDITNDAFGAITGVLLYEAYRHSKKGDRGG